MVTVLAGGTGGAKLARGMLDVVGPERLTVVANTGDDSWMHGAHVSPDPDLVTWWLADWIDERGWGIRDDTWTAMDALEAAGHDVWFRLGDRDLTMCLIRTELLGSGRPLTEAHAAVVDAAGVRARVLPMSDETVETWVRCEGRWRAFQEFMILERGKDPEAVELRGIAHARPADHVLQAIAEAEAIVIGPSNPVISIGPILELPGMREALRDARAPVIAVSPFVGGRAVKGPTEQFCAMAGIEQSAAGIARAYDGVIDGMVADEPVDALPCTVIDTLMDTPEDRSRVARAALELAQAHG